MAFNLLPKYCSRLRIFLSYSSSDRSLAEKIAQALKNSGHKLFFDQHSLPPGGDYNERIRAAIGSSDRFVMLIGAGTLDPGKYTLTELDFAQKKWPSPVGRVFPVLLDPGMKGESLPAYLSSVQAMHITGNAPAYIAAEIERSRQVNGVCSASLAAATLAFAGVAALASFGSGRAPFEASLMAPDYAHFRPREKPPDNPAAPDAGIGWTQSPVTLTLPVSYSNLNAKAAPTQILGEEAVLTIGGRTVTFAWSHVVEIIASSIGDRRCGDDWLCRKANVKSEKINPGDAVPTRETMFTQTGGALLTWRDFVDAVLAANGPAAARIVMTSRLAAAGGAEVVRTRDCVIDVAGARGRMLAARFAPGKDPRPAIWQPRCQTR